MKKNLHLVLAFFMLFSLNSYSQWVSPGNNNSYTLDDLVTQSAGVVTFDGTNYHFTAAVTISASDTLKIMQDGLLYIHEGILWTIEGVLITNPPSLFEIKKQVGSANFEGIRFDNSSSSSLKGLMLSNSGGIKLVDSDMEFLNCSFTDFGQEYTTATVDLYHSSPLIRDCSFTTNAGPAIGSGANGASSPQIINNLISFNVTSNSNTPQINLGTSDGFLPIIIDSNHVYGQYEMAGGIAVSTLAGGNANAIITNNDITLNRYGIAMIGSNITSVISYNSIVQNDIQGDPMQGGSGINFYGGATNTSIVSYNHISHNLWGITIQLNAQPNMGDGTDDSPGHNMIILNENSFQIYGLYNNTPDDIMAMNNFWGTTDLAMAENYIYHEFDDASLGWVFFDPLWINPVGIAESQTILPALAPNPCSDYVEISYKSNAQIRYEVYGISGNLIGQGQASNNDNRISVANWARGSYFIKIFVDDLVFVEKIVVR